MSLGRLDEKGGYFYEALLRYSLTKCDRIPGFVMHEKLGNLAVVSDVIIPSKEYPQAVILVTHSFSENGTHMKTWRNIDEMLYIREHFPKCAIINMLFPSEWKKNLVEIMGTICDYQFIFPEKIGKVVTKMALLAIKENLRDEEAYDLWIENHKELKSVIDYITSQYDCLFDDNISVDKRWSKYSDLSLVNKKCCTISYKGDYKVKKGLIKLALLSDNERTVLFDNKAKLNLISKTEQIKFLNYGILFPGIHTHISEITRLILFDIPENIVANTFRLLNELFYAEIIKMLQPLNGIDNFNLDVFLNCIRKKNALELKNYFYELIIKWNDNYSDEINLPLYYLYAIETCNNPRFSHRILSSMCDGLIPSIWSLSMLMSGKHRTSSQVMLGKNALLKICEVFVESFRKKEFPKNNAVWDKLVYLVEDKLIKHKNANCLLYLCIAKCQSDGIQVNSYQAPHIHIGNGIAKYCAENGVIVGNDAAQTSFSFSLEYKKTTFIFSVISANSSTHKHKEYPARWRCANIEYKNGVFRKTSDNRKWIVLLDGIWNELFRDLNETLEKFALAGAAGIYDVYSFVNFPDIKRLLDDCLDT